MNSLVLYRKCRDRFNRWFVFPVQLLWLKHIGVECGARCRFHGLPIINKCEGSIIQIGDDLDARSKIYSNTIGMIQPIVITTTHPSAKIIVGNQVGISGSTLECRELIQIGDRVAIGSGVLILDSDSHSLDPAERRAGVPNIRSAPVILEEDVFVGARSIILKGTRIGARTIVRAGSVVLAEFPADCIIGGNPATIIARKQ
jgi:acetyltransferase-like isoleucine patch superfamily enzyme